MHSCGAGRLPLLPRLLCSEALGLRIVDSVHLLEPSFFREGFCVSAAECWFMQGPS